MRKKKLNIQSHTAKGHYNELSKECSGYVVLTYNKAWKPPWECLQPSLRALQGFLDDARC